MSQELIDDHVDFVVINGEASDLDDDEHLHKVGHNLLLDTAPSLKLSNLMVSQGFLDFSPTSAAFCYTGKIRSKIEM